MEVAEIPWESTHSSMKRNVYTFSSLLQFYNCYTYAVPCSWYYIYVFCNGPGYKQCVALTPTSNSLV